MGSFVNFRKIGKIALYTSLFYISFITIDFLRGTNIEFFYDFVKSLCVVAISMTMQYVCER